VEFTKNKLEQIERLKKWLLQNLQSSIIDIAVISSSFKGDRYSDRRIIVPLRRGINSRIDPIPFTPEDYAEGGILIDEIKSTGQEIL